MNQPVFVVKIGGSLCFDATLKDWLDLIAEHGRGRVVIVPGGGAFADTVRGAQRQLLFSDAAAHRMAILAMQQYGMMLCDLNARLVGAATEQEIDLALIHHFCPVWLPAVLLEQDESLPQSWQITSDSLAAWLAHRLQAHHLILIKAPDAVPRAEVAPGWSEELVDASFPAYVESAPFATTLVGKREFERVLGCLRAS